MNELLNSLVNGNLKDAKRIAKRFKAWDIRFALMDYGYSEHKAMLTVDWLKGRDCWQEACDAQ